VKKTTKKQRAIDGFQHTACFDLQAVFIAPDEEILSFYYKRRLATLLFIM